MLKNQESDIWHRTSHGQLKQRTLIGQIEKRALFMFHVINFNPTDCTKANRKMLQIKS